MKDMHSKQHNAPHVTGAAGSLQVLKDTSHSSPVAMGYAYNMHVNQPLKRFRVCLSTISEVYKMLLSSKFRDNRTK